MSPTGETGADEAAGTARTAGADDAGAGEADGGSGADPSAPDGRGDGCAAGGVVGGCVTAEPSP
ncbi:hypothetical protein FM076_11355 [Streptomyces albus subsp. chlorinus]|uniref:hypothetical protein n=1 Tax=Streptomyces albus TaxID=1888 RepID=UPI00156F24FD|nr:hypothetical protein [Streptomyces albus]NSC21769.1 hypothetical protein [Streptomyces albus subsp. chlorinus]